MRGVSIQKPAGAGQCISAVEWDAFVSDSMTPRWIKRETQDGLIAVGFLLDEFNIWIKEAVCGGYPYDHVGNCLYFERGVDFAKAIDRWAPVSHLDHGLKRYRSRDPLRRWLSGRFQKLVCAVPLRLSSSIPRPPRPEILDPYSREDLELPQLGKTRALRASKGAVL